MKEFYRFGFKIKVLKQGDNLAFKYKKLIAELIHFIETSGLGSKETNILFVFVGELDDKIDKRLKLLLVPERVGNVHTYFVDSIQLLFDLEHLFYWVLFFEVYVPLKIIAI